MPVGYVSIINAPALAFRASGVERGGLSYGVERGGLS
jgi:hypothetical protein